MLPPLLSGGFFIQGTDCMTTIEGLLRDFYDTENPTELRLAAASAAIDLLRNPIGCIHQWMAIDECKLCGFRKTHRDKQETSVLLTPHATSPEDKLRQSS